MNEPKRIIVCPSAVGSLAATLSVNRGPTTAVIDAVARAISVILFHEFLHLLFDDVSKFSVYTCYINLD
jgi:hypothetical protein